MNNARIGDPSFESGSLFSHNGLSGDLYGWDETRPGIVLLPGLTFGRRIWDPAIAAFRALDPTRRVLALDLPGQGESSPLLSYDLEAVAAVVHDALEHVDFGDPVLVGHSIAAIIASIYGVRFPVRGVVNVDQPLQTAPFAEMLHGMADQLRSSAFPSIWSAIARSFNTEQLPMNARDLVEATSVPRQDVVLGYWKQVMEQQPAERAKLIDFMLTSLRERAVPYLVVGGWQPETDYVAWLRQALPQVEMVILPGSGHFPFLAHPDWFANEIISRF